MEEFITETVLRFGYVAIFVLMVAESACIPIPSEVTMLFGGALANTTFVSSFARQAEPLDFFWVGLIGTLANVVGSWIAYWVGRVGGRPLIERWGRYVFLREHELERAHAWFARHGEAAVFVSRLLPVIRTFISLPAGVAEMPFVRFTVYTFLGCLPWTFALTAFGYALGRQWHVVERYFRPVSIAVGVATLALGAWWFYRRFRQKRDQELAGRGKPL